MTLEATHLRDDRWAVKPAGQLGTCGWYPAPWTVLYVRAPTEPGAIRRARHLLRKLKEAAHVSGQ